MSTQWHKPALQPFKIQNLFSLIFLQDIGWFSGGGGVGADMQVRMNIFFQGLAVELRFCSKLAKSTGTPSNSMRNDGKEENRHKQTHKWVWGAASLSCIYILAVWKWEWVKCLRPSLQGGQWVSKEHWTRASQIACYIHVMGTEQGEE